MTHLRYAVIETNIGPMFLAATPRGLCSLRLLQGIGKGEVEAGLKDMGKRFPDLPPQENEKGLAPLARQVRDVIAGKAGAEGIPLDMPGTAFQRRVWQTLVRLPWGQTCTYTQLAERAGLPRAIRAAASACARNPVAFVVPCHRVLATGGGLGGYYYGLSVKQQLLERERGGGGKKGRPV